MSQRKRMTVQELEKLDEYTVSIICLNKIHKITLRKRGAVTLHNHNHKLEARNMKLGKALGAETPKCMRVLQEWKEMYDTGATYRRWSFRHQRRQQSMPFQVRTMRSLASQDASNRKYKIPYTGNRGNTPWLEKRWPWMKVLIAADLARIDMYATESGGHIDSADANFRVRPQAHWSDWRLSSSSFSIGHWAYRIKASGMSNVSPRAFFPLNMQWEKDEHESHLWLSYINMTDHKLERMKVEDGNCPACITDSESQAKYSTALRKYRALESASRGNQSDPHTGGR